jgi:hypothetical protein
MAGAGNLAANVVKWCRTICVSPAESRRIEQYRSRAQRGCVFVDPHRAGLAAIVTTPA